MPGGANEWVNASGRPTTGDLVRVINGHDGLSAGDICKVTHDDHDSSPYRLKKVGTSEVKGYWFSERDVEKVRSIAEVHGRDSAAWIDATGRPTVGDFVRLKVSKEGLSPGDICEVTHDDRDGNPYKLKKVGTSSVKSYFTVAMVQKVVRGGAVAQVC